MRNAGDDGIWWNEEKRVGIRRDDDDADYDGYVMVKMIMMKIMRICWDKKSDDDDDDDEGDGYVMMTMITMKMTMMMVMWW